ncbi:hypothetical protein BD310DRAFT_689047 [Dichomitus squalens]|uniref:Uncharacterized protein n=1 Tax=Dichomitus squalens TaxID=114155 RepID=A0A4Q9PMH4_9APHY|nr:hypothetical protein BD310DRAFT_689047 [Dichomitus squalens]
MADISVANAELLGLWLQLLTTGAYLLYVPRAAIALRQKMRDGLSFWLPLISGMFFVLAVMEIVVEMLRGYEAVGSHQGERPDPEAYYANPATTKSLIKNYIITAESFLSDAVIVYRTFIVWNQNLLVITIPFMLFLSSIGKLPRFLYLSVVSVWMMCATVGVGVWAAWTLSQTRSGDVLILAAVTVRVRYFFILTFCLNSVCTGLICWKIWRVTKMSVHAHVHSPLSRLLRVIVESAAVYCLYLLVLIITDSVGTNIFFTFFNIVRRLLDNCSSTR